MRKRLSYEMAPWLRDFLDEVRVLSPSAQPSAATQLSSSLYWQLFASQASSRLLDLRSRLLQAQGESFYTIGSAGHEGNVVLGHLLSLQDMLFLHYRSGALFIERSQKLPGQTPLYDLLASFVASRHCPISGGRHKVLGSKALNIPPQTSTIASHLPKAVGAAFALGLKQRHGQANDAIVMSSFGDASLNHASAQCAFNSAAWTSYQHLAMPLLFVCEDNGLGISTPSPLGWVAQFATRYPQIKYFFADTGDLESSYLVTQAAIDYVRTTRKPAFLHLKVVRLFGHAGADAQTAYLSHKQIAAQAEQDPLRKTAQALIDHGYATATQIVTYLSELDKRINEIANEVINTPKLTDVASITETLHVAQKNHKAAIAPVSDQALEQCIAKSAGRLNSPQSMAKLLNWVLQEQLMQYPELVVFGEDVAKKGGVYGITQHLQKQFGANRVFNTLLDETSILGLAIGLSQQGFLPVAEIQFLAYVHNAEDQIRGEAATLSFFSAGQFDNPMVIRIAGLGYQKGFGGHFHNDNSLAVFRDIPGLIVLCPSNPEDAVLLFRQAVKLAYEERKVVVFIEPIALYNTRDLYLAGDNQWLSLYPSTSCALPAFGEPKVQGEGKQLAIVSYANGAYLSLQAMQELELQGYSVRVIDIRYLVPLQVEAIIQALGPCQHILIVDECRQRGSLSEELFALLHEACPARFNIARVCGVDSFIPLGAAAYTLLPSSKEIVEAAKQLLNRTNVTKEPQPWHIAV